MKEKISILTKKVIAFSEIPDFNMDECIDWAIEMYSLGYDTPSLLKLASLDKPTNYFETVEYLKNALSELNLEIKTGEEGILSYSSYFIIQISQGIKVKENLRTVYLFCQEKDYEKLLYDFYLLYWAWSDLDYGNAHQDYWPNANKENIESVVKSVAYNWLKEYNNSF